jgi:ubiquinone biosynthesis protein COQ9
VGAVLAAYRKVKSHLSLNRSVILKNAVSLVPTLGFTRLAVSQAASNVLKHENLPERSLDMLFGKDDVRKTLIRAWLEEGFDAMGSTPTTVRDALHKRLDWNKPVLDKLAEVSIFILHCYFLTLLS